MIHLALVLILPILLASVIRKTKALMQGRPGPPFFQFLFDQLKRMRKGETVSSATSWFFAANPLVALGSAFVLALVLPWTGAQPIAAGTGAADLMLVIYLLGAARFFAILAALDAGSAFGGLGGSRESLLSVLVEPAIVISLAAASLSSGTTDLSVALCGSIHVTVAILSGIAFLLASLAELSRMPVDDPNTHLELTMIHEATILENSGRNLGLIELSVALRTALFFGIGVRLLLAGLTPGLSSGLASVTISLFGILLLGVLLGVFEGMAVKLNWRRVPSLMAFATALAVMSAFVAAVRI